jgi:hypothetical protein
MRLRNTTDIPNEIIRDVVRFVRPPGIRRFRVLVINSRYPYAGCGSSAGVKVRINTGTKYPRKLRTYQIGQLKGRRYYLASIVEALIYILAHELMHVRQGQKGNLRGKIWGSRGTI